MVQQLDFSYLNRPTPDIGQTVLQALQIRAALQQRQQANAANERASTLRQLQSQYLAGDKSALGQMQQIGPQESLQFQNDIAQQQETQLSAEESQRKNALGVTNRLGSFLDLVSTNPQLYPSVRNQIVNDPGIPDSIKGMLPEQVDPPVLKDFRARLDAQRAILSDPEQVKVLSKYGKIATDRGLRPGTKEFQTEVERLAKEDSGRSGINIYTGDNVPLNRAAENEVQRGAVDDVLNLGDIRAIDELSFNAKPYFTYFGRGRDALYEVLNKAGVNSEGISKSLQEMQRLRTNTANVFARLRKEITGAGAGVDELNRLEQEFLSLKMSPEQFEAAVGELKKIAQRSYRIKWVLLNRGLRPGTDKFNRNYALLYDTSDPISAHEDARARARELAIQFKRLNWTRERAHDEIVKRLEVEGWNVETPNVRRKRR
jgi:hypothetical protein